MNIEKEISDIVLQASRCFSASEIATYSGIELETLKSREKSRYLPPEDFEKYIAAFEKCRKMPRRRKPNEKFNEEKWDELSKATVKLTKIAVQEYKQVNDLFEIVYWLIIKDANATSKISPLFSYRVANSFDAFASIEHDDLSFLRCYFTENSVNRAWIKRRLNNSACHAPSEILSMLSQPDIWTWLRAKEQYLSCLVPSKTAYKSWEKFREKVKVLTQTAYKSVQEGDNRDLMRLVYLSIFISMIWPKDGEKDTVFGADEIDALIIFKFFLTESAQKMLLAELETLPKST